MIGAPDGTPNPAPSRAQLPEMHNLSPAQPRGEQHSSPKIYLKSHLCYETFPSRPHKDTWPPHSLCRLVPRADIFPLQNFHQLLCLHVSLYLQDLTYNTLKAKALPSVLPVLMSPLRITHYIWDIYMYPKAVRLPRQNLDSLTL